MDALLTLVLLGTLAGLWVDGLRARERALMLCARGCDQRHLQLLDQTVALRRIRLCWGAGGLRLRRVYRFEFTEVGEVRRSGYLVLRGIALEELSFGLPARAEDA
ncbi:DUF3301 domain-containing protein [Marichromatium bheemlicum]|uniref:DUF3301 domain-containing protein n=1 Tax=Marichromatium bheemlicum TaxID=365339 RepID=A0ABX1IA08_9GAMM|nr:DUF3301 domain-containing protein [Marichromatium bheemlicum]NKN33884.1 DUF3301 domain-containing protein [Marichromatium bheemlicum]